jgi:hypothetical protein
MPPNTGKQWLGIIRALHLVDKQIFPELVSRVSTPSSGNLFSSKEAEIAAKAVAIRRLTCAIFASEKDTHLIHLAVIQEKLVEVLRGGQSSVILGEVGPHLNLSWLFPGKSLCIDIPLPQGSACSLLSAQSPRALAGCNYRDGLDTLAASLRLLISEQIHIIKDAIRSPPSDASEEFYLVLSICKFIDLAVTVQTPELQT